jgi:hypothetical protein
MVLGVSNEHTSRRTWSEFVKACGRHAGITQASKYFERAVIGVSVIEKGVWRG